jgi:hypothetical protein
MDKNGSLVILTKYSIPKEKDNFEKIIEDKYAETFLGIILLKFSSIISRA